MTSLLDNDGKIDKNSENLTNEEDMIFKEYCQDIERFSVDEEMRSRVLDHVQTHFRDSRETGFSFQRFPYIAAAIVLLACVALFSSVQNNRPSYTSEKSSSEIATSAKIAAQNDNKYDSLEALSSAVGFSVKELHELPFNVEEMSFSKLGDAAETIYRGDSQYVALVQTKSSADPVTKSRETIEINGKYVYLKESEGGYYSAWWEDGGFTYTLYLGQSYTLEDVQIMLSGVD